MPGHSEIESAIRLWVRKAEEDFRAATRLPAELRPDLSGELQSLLTDYAVTIRYPGEEDEPDLAQARTAARTARLVRSHVRRLLPRNTLRLTE
jgi:hypothetical protein